MSIHGPADGWVIAPDGRKFWGKAGAAGLLVIDDRERVLLQHRVSWSHFGGTWGIPGGARQFDESAVDGALRESAEEAAVPPDALRLVFTSVLDLGFWSYTTVVARTRHPFDPVISDGESEALSWIPLAEVERLPLHPGFAASWPRLVRLLGRPLHLVIDAANVVGSRPDGWWRDRVGATERLAESLAALASEGVPAAAFAAAGEVGTGAGADNAVRAADQPGVHTWWPEITLVVEGQATAARGPADQSPVRLVRAARDGDAAIVAEVESLAAAGGGLDDGVSAPALVVVTADRALAARVRAVGAAVVGPGVLLALVDALR